jgi:Ala-tRNA(Pro) deacylase
MSIATTVKNYLDAKSIDYQVVAHTHTESSLDSAGAAHIPSDQLAKAVIVKEQETYMMVIVPSDFHVHMGKLHHLLGREVGLATEPELGSLFADCDEGAIPPLGTAYQMVSLVDEGLLNKPQVYFESGDHEHLVKVTGAQFASLLGDAERVNVAAHE